MSGLKYWIWLSSLSGVRPRTKTRLLDYCGGAREIYYAPGGEYAQIEGIERSEIEQLGRKDMDEPLRLIDRCAEKGVAVLTMQDAAYPRRLAGIYDPPAVIYVLGRLPAVDEEAAIAVVGTRSATPYGMKMGQRLGYEITKCGALVVSGLTSGIDAAGALGALRAGGSCIGVLGTAIDAPLSPLARDVMAVGALVSEYPPGTQGRASFFRARNRVTSGLSVGTVVVEAPDGSGALLFADEALEQGREVFVVPANADAPMGAGSNRLLKDGARPVTSGWDIVSGFESRFPSRLHPPGVVAIPQEEIPKAETPVKKRSAKEPETGEDFAVVRQASSKKVIDKQNAVPYIDLKKQLEGLSAPQLAIVSVMTEPDMHVDDIIDLTQLPAAQVLSEMTILQIKGVVSQGAGKRFTLNISKK